MSLLTYTPTAEESRTLALKNRDELLAVQLSNVIGMISQATYGGKLSIKFNGLLEPETRKQLEQQGYLVTVGESDTLDFKCLITW